MKGDKKAGEFSAIVVLDGGRDVENIWVRKKKGNVCQVRTIPFWAYNLSLDDMVECEPDEDGEGLFIERVIEKSGNKTVRVAFQSKAGLADPEAIKLKSYFNKRKLSFEEFEPQMFAVNVPSEEEYELLVKRLEEIPARAKMIAEDGDPQPNRNLDGSFVKGRKQKPRA